MQFVLVDDVDNLLLTRKHNQQIMHRLPADNFSGRFHLSTISTPPTITAPKTLKILKSNNI